MGRCRGGLTAKIRALVDAEGRPIRLSLTPGQAGNAPQALPLIEGIATGATLFADKAYDTNAIRAFANSRKAWANIPAVSTRKGTFTFSK